MEELGSMQRQPESEMYQGSATKECLQLWRQDVASDPVYTESSWAESVCNEPRCDGRNVGTDCCTFPNLQPIDWALAEFTRPLYLHFFKTWQACACAKGALWGYFWKSCKDCWNKKTSWLWKWADICILPLISMAYSVHIKCWHARRHGGVCFYLHRGSRETRIIGWDSLCLLLAVISLLQYFRDLPLGSVEGKSSRNYLDIYLCLPADDGEGGRPWKCLSSSGQVESQTDALSLPQIIYAWGRWSWERSCSTGEKVNVSWEDRKTTRAEDAVKCIEGDENNKALLSYVLLCLFVCVENVDFYAYFSI